MEINIKSRGKIPQKHKEMKTAEKNQEIEEIKEDYSLHICAHVFFRPFTYGVSLLFVRYSRRKERQKKQVHIALFK